MSILRPLRAGLRAAAPALALGVAGLTVACADAPTSPAAPRATASAATGTVRKAGMVSGVSVNDTVSVVLNIRPTMTTTFLINQHRVQIVAGSICDPAKSGYGPTLWNAPCTPAATAVTVTAKSWTTPTGRPVITFSPDLRFVPGKVNTIWLLDPTAASSQTGKVAWCPTGSTVCVDESLVDPSVATQYTTDGFAYRRIKHFSGYTVIF